MPWITLPRATIGPLELPRPSGMTTSTDFAGAPHRAPRGTVAHGDEQLVVVERHAALRDLTLPPKHIPDQIAGLPVDRCTIRGVVQIDRAVVRERGRLMVPPSFIATPTRAADRGRCRVDLRQRTEFDA